MPCINEPLSRKLRMGLVGGGGRSFIGPVHYTAATMDHRAELVAGALSSDPHRARAAAPDFGISEERAYDSSVDLIQSESKLPEEKRIDFVSIATPNFTHFEIARGALQAGFNVVCDKPLTTSLAQAEALASLVEQTGAVFALTHNYSGYALVRQARAMVLGGELGEIEAVRVNYIQGGLRSREPGTTPPRGAWKGEPDKAGPGGTVGDIGTHAYQLARYITGLLPNEVSSQLTTFFPGRKLDDYGHALLRFQNGALGNLTFSQVTHGRLNDLAVEVDGTTGSFCWRQEDPNILVVRRFGKAVQIYEQNPRVTLMHASARRACRVPGGHPEGFLEAFANVYCDSFEHMIARAANESFDGKNTIYPNVYDGVEGVYFIEQCVASHRDNAAWKPLRHPLARR
ncbi:MAG: Gfo/Idh/MocA family protein [Pirellulaceae bacterium]